MIDTTTDYGKQAYLMYEDLATQLNFLKNKNTTSNTTSGDSNTSTKNQTMIELLGGIGVGSVTKKYLKFYPTPGQNSKYTILLKITNASADGQFHAHIFFDKTNMSKKVFMVSGNKANVLFGFEYLSQSGEVEVEIVVESFEPETQFCLDQIVTISDAQTLTCDYPHRCDDGASYKLYIEIF